MASFLSSVSAVKDVVLLGSLHSVHCVPLNHIDAFEFKCVLDVILIGRAPMPRFREPTTSAGVLRSWQEGDLVEEVIYRLVVVFGEPSRELVGIFAITVDVAMTRLARSLKD
jgi:hypothetical protein